MEMTWRSWLGLMLLVQSLEQCSGSAKLQIQMLTFKNSNEKDWNGKDCDLWGVGQCDHIFKFCLDSAGSGDETYSGCDYFSGTTNEFPDDNENTFDHDMNGVANPIQHTFTKWPSSGVKFKVQVRDDDSGHSGHDLVDRLRYVIAETPDRSSKYAIWQQKLIRGFRTKTTKTSLSFKFKLYCEDNYFGSDCGTYCKAEESTSLGYYTCHPDTGQKQCRPGWEGRDCKIRSDDCASNPCINGVCVDGNRAYKCNCTAGYTGVNCQENINECDSSPCIHGDCADRVNGYVCLCKAGYIGQNCGMDVCAAAGATHCRNGGSCVLAGGSPKCLCTEEFRGEQCEIDKCAGVTCHNGGSCHAGKCTCLPGFKGAFCGVDLCEEHPCHNGGSCVGGQCQCANGAHGKYCQFACNYDTCENDGTCVANIGVDGYRCLCLPQYNGANCEFLIPTPPPDETSPEEEVPIEDKEDESVAETDDGTTTTTTTTPNPSVNLVDRVVDTGESKKDIGNNFPPWIIGLIVGLIFAIVVIMLIAYILVKRYRRKARRAENTVAQMDNGVMGMANPVYIADPMPEGAVGPAVFLHGDPPPYKEKIDDPDDPAYSVIAPSTSAPATATKSTPNADSAHYDNIPSRNAAGADTTYDVPRPTKSPSADLGEDAAGGEEAPPLPMKQKDLGEQAPPLPEKQRPQ